MHRDDQGRFVSDKDVERYEITVWRISDGDIIEEIWRATERELDDVEERYRDDPDVDIQVEDKSI